MSRRKTEVLFNLTRDFLGYIYKLALVDGGARWVHPAMDHDYAATVIAVSARDARALRQVFGGKIVPATGEVK